MVCAGAGEPREEGRGPARTEEAVRSVPASLGAVTAKSTARGRVARGVTRPREVEPSSELRQRLPSARARGARHLPRPESEAAPSAPQVSLAFPLRFSSATPSVCAELGAACKAPQGASAASRDAPASPRAPAARGPAQRPRRSARLRSADRGGGRVVGTDATRLLCLARTQSRARPGGGSGSHFMAPGPTSCLHPKSFEISIHRGFGRK